MNFKKKLNFLNGTLHVLTLKQNSLNIFLGGEIHLDCFEFKKKTKKYTHAVFYLFNNSQPGLVKFRDTNFYPFFFEMINFSLRHKESSCHCPSANNFSRKEKLLWSKQKFDLLRHLWAQWTFRTPQYTLFYKPLHI